MTTVLLDSVMGGFNKPYTRNFWSHSETKKTTRLKFISDPYLYTDASQNVGRDSNSTQNVAVYGFYAAGRECVVKTPGASFGSENTTQITQTAVLFTSTDGLSFTNVALPVGSYRPTGLTFFNNKWWLFTAAKIYISTDSTASSFIASTAAPPGTLYRPFVFNGKILVSSFASNSGIRSTTTGETFSSHNLPISGYVVGMATDGTTLVILILNNGLGYVYKTTDLTTWTPMEVRWTTNGVNISNTGTSLGQSGFYPLGIVYTGTKFVIAATDMTTNSLTTDSMSVVRFFTASNSSSNFVLTGSYTQSEGSNPLYSYGGRSYSGINLRFNNNGYSRCSASHCMTMHGSRIFMTIAISGHHWVDASLYNLPSIVQIYSDDQGETWSLVRIPVEAFTAVTGAAPYIVTDTYSTPNGVVSLYAPSDSSIGAGYLRPNPNCKELVTTIR